MFKTLTKTANKEDKKSWIKKLITKEKTNKYLASGDVVNIIYNGEQVCTYSVEEDLYIDEFGIFEFRNEFGLTKGLGGYFGKRY